MGSDKEESFETKAKEPKRVVKTYTACLWSFLVSLTGGLMLAWWEYEYHPTYRQLWMVPFGLILFTTPVIIWFAIFVSDICSFTEHVRPPDGSVHDPEKMIKKIKNPKHGVMIGVNLVGEINENQEYEVTKGKLRREYCLPQFCKLQGSRLYVFVPIPCSSTRLPTTRS
ncbi:Putative ATP-synthase-associated protein - like 1 [Theobroma cacao]|nr:Putative ATP-synthase-associated protein - like 1 [Theobroma cacao]